MKRRGVELGKDILIALLLASAALLALLVVRDSGAGRRPAWFERGAEQPPRLAQAPARTDAAQPTVISVLGQTRASFWGDFAALDAAYESLGSHLAAALDTAGTPEEIPREAFAAAAAGQGVYFRFPGPVSLAVLGSWLDAEAETALEASEFFLAPEEDRVALLAGDGARCFRMETQADAALLRSALDDYPADGTHLAVELDEAYRRLAPLTLVDPSRTALAAAESENPCDDVFLSATAEALGFNPYGDSHYRDGGGDTVYTESDCSLRISADGLLTLRNPGLAARFSAASAEDGDRIEYVRALLQTLAGAQLGDARLQFSGFSRDDEGDAATFSYLLAGLPVEQSQGPAVSARFQGAVLQSLTFRVRTYTLHPTERVSLLPAAQAAAVQPDGAGLQPAYADVGERRLQCGWLDAFS